MIEFRFRDVIDATGARALTGGLDRLLSGVSTDSRSVAADQLFVALSGPNFDANEFAATAVSRGAGALLLRDGADDFSTARGESVEIAVHPDPRRALGDLAAWVRSQLAARVVGVTGTCGKTTVKDLLGQLLSHFGRTVVSPSSYNNEVGVPLTIFAADATTKYLVCEMGTSAPGEIEALCRIARPEVGVVTNIGAGHLELLGSVEGVAEEKGSLPASLPAEGVAVLNADCPFVGRMRNRTAARVIETGLGERADLRATEVEQGVSGTSFRLRGRTVRSPLLGEHNVRNLLSALAVVEALGHPLDEALEVVDQLEGSGRRMQRHELGEITLLDDSYNANPESVRAAMRVLEGFGGEGRRRILVLGDMLELGELERELHHEVGMEAARAGLEMVVAVGELAMAVAAGALEGGLPGEAVLHFERAGAAAATLPDLVRPGDVVLVKASRGVRLEQVVDTLLERFQAPAC